MRRVAPPGTQRGGRLVQFVHVAQLAEALGLPVPPQPPEEALSDAETVLRSPAAWFEAAPWQLLLEPARSVGRSCRKLSIGILLRSLALAESWETRKSDYRGEGAVDARRCVDDSATLIALAVEAATALAALAPRVAAADDRVVNAGLRGLMRFSLLADFHRRYAAYHHRQIADFLHGRGVAPPATVVDTDALGIPLPAAVY